MGPCEPLAPSDLDALDEAIAADEAGKRTPEEIRHRLARCAAFAALPDATDVDRHAADDWRRILAAKLGGPDPHDGNSEATFRARRAEGTGATP